jgi:DNA (cytosine-5)-methyltransferase 1
LFWVADSEHTKRRPINGSVEDELDRDHAVRPEAHGELGARGEVRGLEHSDGAWSDSVWLPCADGKARRAQSGIHPLAHGVPGRVGLLRGYGNAIVPQVAAEFIKAFLEASENL